MLLCICSLKYFVSDPMYLHLFSGLRLFCILVIFLAPFILILSWLLFLNSRLVYFLSHYLWIVSPVSCSPAVSTQLRNLQCVPVAFPCLSIKPRHVILFPYLPVSRCFSLCCLYFIVLYRGLCFTSVLWRFMNFTNSKLKIPQELECGSVLKPEDVCFVTNGTTGVYKLWVRQLTCLKQRIKLNLMVESH